MNYSYVITPQKSSVTQKNGAGIKYLIEILHKQKYYLYEADTGKNEATF